MLAHEFYRECKRARQIVIIVREVRLLKTAAMLLCESMMSVLR
jgi:hypothetical protein